MPTGRAEQLGRRQPVVCRVNWNCHNRGYQRRKDKASRDIVFQQETRRCRERRPVGFGQETRLRAFAGNICGLAIDCLTETHTRWLTALCSLRARLGGERDLQNVEHDCAQRGGWRGMAGCAGEGMRAGGRSVLAVARLLFEISGT